MFAGVDEHFYVLSITEFADAGRAENDSVHREIDTQFASGIKELGARNFKAAQIKISGLRLDLYRL